MKSSQNSSEPTEYTEPQISITITDVLEHLFCPRFTYYLHCLNIPQHEETRYKVLQGRQIHHKKRMTNQQYLRKKIPVTRKEIEIPLASKKHKIHGIIDEILFLKDGTAAPLEYKFAEYKNKIHKTHKYQLTIQAILIQENYNTQVNQGYICYTRSNNLIKEIKITQKNKENAIKIINEILEIVQTGHYPHTKHTTKCTDCCYRNICIQ